MKTVMSIVIASTLAAASLWAQNPGPNPGPNPGGPSPGSPQQPDLIRDSFFPPELLMQHSRAIGLSDEQLKAIKAEVLKTQSHFTELQWDLSSELQAMAAVVNQERVDEKEALAHLDKILSLESEIKKTQAILVIRIKNQLTAEQQAKLRELRRPMRPNPQGGPQRPGGPRPQGPPGQGGGPRPPAGDQPPNPPEG